MKKIIPLPLLILFSLFHTSCDGWKDDPLPAADFQMERSFTNTTTSEVNKASYTETSATSDIILNRNGEMIILFSASAEDGRDHVYFTIPAENVKHNFIGRYTLKSMSNNGAGDIQTYYGFHISSTTFPPAAASAAMARV